MKQRNDSDHALRESASVSESWALEEVDFENSAKVPVLLVHLQIRYP